MSPRRPCPYCGSDAAAGVCPRSIACPRSTCGAGPGARCRRPSGHPAEELHAERVAIAERRDVLDQELDAALDERVRAHRDRAAGRLDVPAYLASLARVREIEERIEPRRRELGALCSRALELSAGEHERSADLVDELARESIAAAGVPGTTAAAPTPAPAAQLDLFGGLS